MIQNPRIVRRQLTFVEDDKAPAEVDLDVLMVGTGEYTTGYVNGSEPDSDKGAGVVALVCLDLKRRGKVGRLGLCGKQGRKLAEVAKHMIHNIDTVYSGIETDTIEMWPDKKEKSDSMAYEKAMNTYKAGDACTIFTPDDTHFAIALAAIERGMHVLLAKPLVKTLEQHKILLSAANKNGVLVMVDVHKRFDPIYVDAKDRIQGLGNFNYFYSYMSQPKHQLDTFREWAGGSSDISFYLNSHHVDFHQWSMEGNARPTRVVAASSIGVAKSKGIDTEDTITLVVTWENSDSPTHGTALYTSSWVAPKSDVHSQQKFFYLGQSGEINIDQAHRGYTLSRDGDGFKSLNPLFMKYTPDSKGFFCGQSGYGYRSIEAFIDAVRSINSGMNIPSDYEDNLATISTTIQTTAILDAGRRSLNAGGCPYEIIYGDDGDDNTPQDIRLCSF